MLPYVAYDGDHGGRENEEQDNAQSVGPEFGRGGAPIERQGEAQSDEGDNNRRYELSSSIGLCWMQVRMRCHGHDDRLCYTPFLFIRNLRIRSILAPSAPEKS